MEVVMAARTLTRRAFIGTTAAGVAGTTIGIPGAGIGSSPDALALKGGTPVRSASFPGWPQTAELDEQNILKSLRNHRWCTFSGEFIPKFEKAWAEIVGTKGCVITPCGTHALNLSLNILDIGPGDEVITSPYSYIATFDSILMCYALPVYADVDLHTFQINPDDIEHRINENTKAIMPVHIYGAAAHMDKINAIGKKHNIPVIEDACQGPLVEWRGKRVGGLSAIGSFSFQESKILPGGEAGAVVSDDMDLIQKAYMFRDFGRDPKDGSNYVIRGTKYRISDFAPAVLMAQLTRFEKISETREKNAHYLTERLKEIPGITPQAHYPESTRSTCYVYGMRYESEYFDGLPKEKFIKAVQAEGIPLGGGYRPQNKMEFMKSSLESRGFQKVFSRERIENFWAKNECPNNDLLCAQALTLPQNVLLTGTKDVDDVVEAIIKVKKNSAAI